MYDNFALGLDISHYDEKIDAEQLKGNVDFLIIKAGGSDGGYIYIDNRFAERVQMAYDIGVPAMAYWFVGPEYWLNQQYTLEKVTGLPDERHAVLQMILNQLRNKLVYGLFFDVEDASIKTASGKVVPQAWVEFYVSDLVRRLRGQMRAGNLREMKLGTYSRKSFIENPNNRQTSLETYLGTQSDLAIWTANWVTGTGLLLPMSEIYNLRPTHAPLTYGYCPDRSADWQFWQWSGDRGKVYRSPAITNSSGYARGLDIDLFNGTPAQLREWLGIQPDQVNPPDPTEPVEDETPPANNDISDLWLSVGALTTQMETLKQEMAKILTWKNQPLE